MKTNPIFTSSLGVVSCLERESLKLTWQTGLRGVGYHPTTLFFDEAACALFVAVNGYTFSLNPDTGSIMWTASATTRGWSVMSLATFKNTLLVLGRADVLALDKDTGRKVWTRRVKYLGLTYSTMHVDEDVVFVGMQGSVYALSCDTGEELWKNTFFGRMLSTFSFLSHDHPALGFGPAERHVIVASRGRVFALHKESGVIARETGIPWTGLMPVSLLDGSAADGRGLIYAASNGQLSARDALTQEEVWNNPLRGCGYSSGISLLRVRASEPAELSAPPSYAMSINAPTAHDGDAVDAKLPLLSGSSVEDIVLVGMNGQVTGIAGRTGEALWRTNLPNCPYFTFVTFLEGEGGMDRDGVLCACNGKLFRLDPKTGEILRRAAVKGTWHGVATLAAPGAPTVNFSAVPLPQSQFHKAANKGFR